jgi:hypothetical protein
VFVLRHGGRFVKKLEVWPLLKFVEEGCVVVE